MRKRRELSNEEKQWAKNLKKIWISKKKTLKENGINLTQEFAAPKLGFETQAAVSHYLNGNIPLNTDAILAFCTLLECKPSEIDPDIKIEITESTVKRLESPYIPNTDSNGEIIGGFDLWDSSTPLGEDEVALPFFREVELAAGESRHEVIENHGAKLRFAKSTLRNEGVQIEHAACVKVSGNSMEPVMPDGTTIGIDTSEKRIIDGEIYAIDHNGHLRIKRLYKMPGGGVRINSYNKEEWPDEIISAEDTHTVRILGVVFWYAVLRKRRR